MNGRSQCLCYQVRGYETVKRFLVESGMRSDGQALAKLTAVSSQ